MALETFLFDVFSGNKAANEIKGQQRASLQDLSREQQRQEDVNAPFLTGGTQGFNTFADLTLSGPGTLDPVSQSLLDQTARGINNQYAAMGLNDSGAHTNALAQALLPLRYGLYQNRLGNLANLAGFGERGANRFNQIGQLATGNRIGVRNNLGEAGAFPWLNASNALNRWEDQALEAAGTVAGGGFA